MIDTYSALSLAVVAGIACWFIGSALTGRRCKRESEQRLRERVDYYWEYSQMMSDAASLWRRRAVRLKRKMRRGY